MTHYQSQMFTQGVKLAERETNGFQACSKEEDYNEQRLYGKSCFVLFSSLECLKSSNKHNIDQGKMKIHLYLVALFQSYAKRCRFYFYSSLFLFLFSYFFFKEHPCYLSRAAIPVNC